MNKEIKTIVKKTAKIAGVTCIAAGAVALMTSAAAIKAMTEGARYLKDTVKKIVEEEPCAGAVVEEVPAAETVTGKATDVESVAEEADFTEPESQEA